MQSPILSDHHGLGLLNSAEDGAVRGPWHLSLDCVGIVGVYIRRVESGIFSGDLEFQQVDMETTVGTATQPDTWFYSPSEDLRTDYLTYAFVDSEDLVSAMLDADEMTITIPYEGTPSTVTFPIAGLSHHISEPADLCP